MGDLDPVSGISQGVNPTIDKCENVSSTHECESLISDYGIDTKNNSSSVTW